MAVDLHNKAGDELRLSYGAWGVFLTLAECYGWKPAGTRAPPDFPAGEWRGRYNSGDGQTVEEADAKMLAEVLDYAARDDKLKIALTDAIGYMERCVEADGTPISEQMRMRPADFDSGFPPLLLFLHKGEFVID